jgi:hypothetical protein
VKTAIEEKVRQRQLLASYVYRRQTASQEAQRKRIAAAGIRDYQSFVDATLSDRLLVHQGIQATRDLAASGNPKTLVVGAGEKGLALPIFLGDMTKGAGRNDSDLPHESDLASDLTTPPGLDARTIKALSDPTILFPKPAQANLAPSGEMAP